MATTTRHRIEEQNDTNTLWAMLAIVALVLVAAAAYGGYDYYRSNAYKTDTYSQNIKGGPVDNDSGVNSSRSSITPDTANQ